ncbi:COP-coated vesicle membrane protein gp25L precursor [Strigomonas culicis]|nr:COP-coated vesicle membrane protein gp25L precursor [Strigomonas culicis]|eukprot:EPY33280.1 COP-coated vesicle membrane protein gp25L precursor [Strigomonas culicis]
MTEGDLTQVCFAAQYDSSIPGQRPSGPNPTRTITFDFLLGMELEQFEQQQQRANTAVTRLRPLEAKLQMVDQFIAEAKTQYNYFKEEEGLMRNTNEYMTARVLYLSIVVILIFVGFSAFQIYYMKRYFKKKRMID